MLVLKLPQENNAIDFSLFFSQIAVASPIQIFKTYIHILNFILAWAFAGIVNDMIFAYNIIMLIAWFFFNILNVFSFLCIYSLYLELTDLTKLQDLARLKVNEFKIIKISFSKTKNPCH